MRISVIPLFLVSVCCFLLVVCLFLVVTDQKILVSIGTIGIAAVGLLAIGIVGLILWPNIESYIPWPGRKYFICKYCGYRAVEGFPQCRRCGRSNSSSDPWSICMKVKGVRKAWEKSREIKEQRGKGSN
jgi:hypothetical protein